MGTRNSDYRSESPLLLRLVRQNVPIVIFLVFAVAGMLAVYWYFSPDSTSVEALASTNIESSIESIDPDAPIAPITKPIKPQPVTQRLLQSPPPLLVGIIAGHRGSDSGTECEDGLTEVQITTDLAERVASRLQDEEINAETLDEFDARLDGYSATALISVHVDSCDYVNDLATGYKISGSPYTDSSQLTICMQQAYGDVTGLPYHPNSITPHMANYHAFRKIGPGTPALIIEVGFLNLDREILTTNSDIIVEGLTESVLCFFEDNQ